MRRKPRFVFDVLVDQAGEDFFGLAELAAGVEPLLVGQAAFDDFLPAGLHGEVRLGERDGFFRRIGVLGDQVAGVAGEGVVVDRVSMTGCRRTFSAEFVDLVDRQEVVVRLVAADSQAIIAFWITFSKFAQRT